MISLTAMMKPCMGVPSSSLVVRLVPALTDNLLTAMILSSGVRNFELPGMSGRIKTARPATATVIDPSRMKSHFQEGSPALPSMPDRIPAEIKPEKALLMMLPEKSNAVRVAISSFL